MCQRSCSELGWGGGEGRFLCSFALQFIFQLLDSSRQRSLPQQRKSFTVGTRSPARGKEEGFQLQQVWLLAPGAARASEGWEEGARDIFSLSDPLSARPCPGHAVVYLSLKTRTFSQAIQQPTRTLLVICRSRAGLPFFPADRAGLPRGPCRSNPMLLLLPSCPKGSWRRFIFYSTPF